MQLFQCFTQQPTVRDLTHPLLLQSQLGAPLQTLRCACASLSHEAVPLLHELSGHPCAGLSESSPPAPLSAPQGLSASICLTAGWGLTGELAALLCWPVCTGTQCGCEKCHVHQHSSMITCSVQASVQCTALWMSIEMKIHGGWDCSRSPYLDLVYSFTEAAGPGFKLCPNHDREDLGPCGVYPGPRCCRCDFGPS
jgi:hypothetical protein